VLGAKERVGGGVSVGCRVLGRVRWWKRRKGFGEWGWGWGWEWGGSGGGFVASSRRYIDDKYEMEQVFKKQPGTSALGDFPGSGGKGWGLGWR